MDHRLAEAVSCESPKAHGDVIKISHVFNWRSMDLKSWFHVLLVSTAHDKGLISVIPHIKPLRKGCKGIQETLQRYRCGTHEGGIVNV
ncbi:hypothetical protein NDU88_006058 [Pleurodeles waltl]|uniref:Uncharacterized protein n=1 Tax=Pleurodeles waltl TaxID=8319 RepID=A0AAV7VLQ5_PLEWA|nr:hypothetical protein NDU88_006058 [Pleurodeles waltl]